LKYSVSCCVHSKGGGKKKDICHLCPDFPLTKVRLDTACGRHSGSSWM
jgi:hypothetical protein